MIDALKIDEPSREEIDETCSVLLSKTSLEDVIEELSAFAKRILSDIEQAVIETVAEQLHLLKEPQVR